MFAMTVEAAWLEVNPWHMVKRAAAERQRDRVLSEEQIRAVWKALDDENAIIAAIFRLRVMMAQRVGRCSARRGTRST